MKNRTFRSLHFLFCILAFGGLTTTVLPFQSFAPTGSPVGNHNPPPVEKSSVSFEENRGQFDAAVRYVARTPGANVFLTADEMVYVLPLKVKEERGQADNLVSARFQPSSPLLAFALRMKFAGANSASTFAGENLREQRTNYFRGADESNWRTDIPNFSAVRYANVYDGIGVVWRGRENGAVQYDFLVEPNADANQISIEFDGASDLEIDVGGDLLINTEAGTIKQGKPFSYQEIGGAKQEIESRFIIEESQIPNLKPQIKFALGDYDRSKPLIIDPTVTLNNSAFSTFLGSFADDIANDIAVDANGNAYVTGRTLSPSFPTIAGVFDQTANGQEDVFVTKLNASGTGIVFSTFLGGTFYDEGNGIAVDASGNVYVTGTAASAFPTTMGAYDQIFNGGVDVFVTKLNAGGTGLIYSTYIGATNIDFANDVAIDQSGNAYIVVRTSDSAVDYPTTPGAFDQTFNGFDDVAVTKLNDTGSALVYSTFLGGSSLDVGNAIAVNANGEAIVGGSTVDDATDFPTTPGAYDQAHNGNTDFFVARLNAAGANLIYSTFIGGAGIDNANGLAIDNAGNAYVTGSISPGFPTTAGVFDTTAAGSNEGGLSKLNADGSTLVYSTYFGGTQSDIGRSVAVDAFGNAYVAVSNNGGDYPTTAGAFDTTFNGSTDTVLTVFNAGATALIYSTYFGGTGTDSVSDINLDAVGNVYLTGEVVNSNAFPVTGEAFQTFPSGASDAFVAKFGDYTIAGRAIDTTGSPLANVQIALSGQISGSVLTGADGRFGFLNTATGAAHTITASRSGYNINPPLFNIANLNGNRELVFIGTVGSPTGGAGGTLRFQNLSYNKSENGATVTATVERIGQITTNQPVTVDFQTVNGTAISGTDYAPISGVLTFETFENSKTINIPIQNDQTLEPRENFSILLSNPTNNAEIAANGAAATINILDEDLSNGDLLISEFRQRGRLGATDEYVKIFNPNDFDVTVNAADNSAGVTLAKANVTNVAPVVTIPNLVTIPARGHYLLTNNNPSGGFSLIDYPTGRGTTTAVGDQTFSADIPDNSNLILLRTADANNFNAENSVDAVGFGNSPWKEGTGLPTIGAENSETCFVRKLTIGGLQDTNDNAADFQLIDNHARVFSSGGNQQKIYSTLGAPAPETSESLRLMTANQVSIQDHGAPVFDWATQPNGWLGTITIYRRITNHTNQPIFALRLRVVDIPTAGSPSSRRFSARPDFRLLNSFNEGEDVKGLTLAADRLQPNGGGINSTLTVNAITQNNALLPNESVVVAVRLGIMRYGRFSFAAAVEALQ